MSITQASRSFLVSDSIRYNSDISFQVYPFRWIVLLLYSLSNMANALMWVTFAPITSITESYLGDDVGTLSLVNLLAVIFQILYLPGTILGVLCMKSYGLRQTLLIGLSMTTIGALLRLIGTLCYESISPAGLYVLIFSGQVLCALAQPIFVNIPPLIASEWFPVKERDIATTVGSFCSPVGNALGQIISVVIVSMDSDGDVTGMSSLMAVEMGISALITLLVFLFFRSKPPTPPSASSRLKETMDAGDRRALVSVDRAAGPPMGNAEISWRKTRTEVYELLGNEDYVYLLLAFTIGLGIFNSLITLINQFVEPQGYTSDDAGNFAAVMILCGLVGAGIMTVILDRTHAYRTCLKLGFFLAFLGLVLFSFMLRPGNRDALYVSFALLGLFILPMLPAVLENCSEVTYPLAEDLPVGLLFIGGNILSIGLTYFLQFLLSKDEWTNPPWMPSSLLLILLPFISFLLLLKYNGQYKRRNCDFNISAPLLPLESVTEESAEHMAERLARVHGSEAESSIGRGSSAGWTSKRTSNASAISQQTVN